jgi:DnaK suppressor protein
MNALLTPARRRFNVGSKHGGAIWNSLQELKEMTSRELLDDGPICQNQHVERFSEDLDDREIGFRRRSQLEHRLLEITNAQDRLMDERYGSCIECQEEINPSRLAADPAASLCLDCQKLADGERRFPTM